MTTPLPAPEASQIVTFRLGDDYFAADIYSVERVLRYQPPTPIPNVPDWIVGVIDYQNRVVPVIDLRARFEMPPARIVNETRILVLNADGDWIAALVDAVVEVTSLTAAALAPPPRLFRGLAADYLRGIVRRGERLIIFLDVTKLLSTNERLVLERAAAGAGTDG
jgi:purine-binding chemotaxis protein CheW